MSGQRSRDELCKFLSYVGAKGLMSPTTVESRKASVNKVLSVLDEQEAEDISAIDLDEVTMRFANLHGQNYTSDSLRTYKSRVKSSIEDFIRYVENPMAFKITTSKRDKRPKPNLSGSKEASQEAPVPQTDRDLTPPSAGNSILPIAIRQNLVVHVQGVPFDLTQREARKIANVIIAMAIDDG